MKMNLKNENEVEKMKQSWGNEMVFQLENEDTA